MPSTAIKYHVFKEKNFQGLVYCDYCGKLLWGSGRQGAQCTECGYNCHIACSDMVIQCRPARRYSPDSLSITDSEAESVSKYSVHSVANRHSLERHNSNTLDDNMSTGSNSRKHSGRIDLVNRKLDEPLKSPTSGTQTINNSHEPYSRSSKHSLNTSYRKSLQHQLQSLKLSSTDTMSPHATAKAFTRLVARSKAFFYVGSFIYDVYSWKNKIHSMLVCLLWISICIDIRVSLILPPLLIGLLYKIVGIRQQNASLVLFPRFDENTTEYYTNLGHMQYAFMFLIRLYDNMVYHLQHITLDGTTYRILLVSSLFVSLAFAYFGKWLIMMIGLMILCNRTWIGGSIEALLLFGVEVVQTIADLGQRLMTNKDKAIERRPMEVSVYENQRWWASTGYTSQMLRSERSAWSNITGLEPLPSKDDMPPPAHYIWETGSEWQLDTTGPWTDDVLNIVNLIECDENGWVYSDHRWQNPQGNPDLVNNRSNEANTKALTRRRRWFRKASPVILAAYNKKTM
ncbi:hypothetical protein EDC96DRAFT_495953 [Choanephora cucurbitarum]|nr:hypothetical protein EDC96DRAFT_495953 [Choanephora cucurbitarum]